MEVNFCIYHCIGACCKGFGRSQLGFRTSDKAITREQIQNMAQACEETEMGYTLLRGAFHRIVGITIEGACPFLRQDLCTIYDSPLRPNICRELQPGDQFCEGVRYLHGLVPVSTIGVTSP